MGLPNQTPNTRCPQLLSQMRFSAGRKRQVSFPPLYINTAPCLGPSAQISSNFPSSFVHILSHAKRYKAIVVNSSYTGQ